MSHPASTDVVAERVKTTIREKHLTQLQKVPVAECKPSTRNAYSMPSYFHWMEQWSAKAKEQISSAISLQAISDDTINWDICLYAWMESAAVYLRDWPTVFLASQAARTGRLSEASQLLMNADAEIHKIASSWHPKMHYVTICDLVDDHPDSDPTLDGPFCGAFFSSDPDTPFIGIVFKGTHPQSWEELLVDIRYVPVQSTGGRLWDTHVSQGVFASMFNPFSKLDGKTPFDYIQNAINTIISATGERPTNIHVTGHSLGASYATLCYAELLRQSLERSTSGSRILRDLWTFGSPRVALGDFVDAFDEALLAHGGRSWRISTGGDPVSLVPPVLITDPKFIHLDRAVRVFDGGEPENLESEKGTHPRPPLPVITVNMSHHTPWSYFNAIYYTATCTQSRSPKL